MEPLFDVGGASHILGISVSRLNKLRVSGGGPAYIKMGNRVCYAREDLEHFIKQNRQKSTAQNKPLRTVGGAA
jgi:hypothetical protein